MHEARQYYVLQFRLPYQFLSFGAIFGYDFLLVRIANMAMSYYLTENSYNSST